MWASVCKTAIGSGPELEVTDLSSAAFPFFTLPTGLGSVESLKAELPHLFSCLNIRISPKPGPLETPRC